jgi:16S rRNA (cytosine1407-C5)-methyltransferase
MAHPWDVFPKAFLSKLQEFPVARADAIRQGLAVHKPTTFRVNTLKSANKAVLDELTADGWVIEPVPWYREAFMVRKYGASRIASLGVFTGGRLYLQSLSSMLPALILDPKDGESILDVAAAPGSKTTQLAVLMHNTGKIMANDISPIRLEKLKANLRIQGVTNVTTTQMPAQILSQKLTNQFDKVLVDVPCTMEGHFDATNPKSYKNWSETYAVAFPARQVDILVSAIRCTKPGGSIVYSTCTIAPNENEGVINEILRKENGGVTTEPIQIPGFSFDAPLLTWQGLEYDHGVANCVRVDPTPDMEGFFIAKLRKLS